ncbi:MAG: DUF6442 family protein [Ruminococcus sp.]|nr:DUF6442 family protein [Ruminococcus sp.]
MNREEILAKSRKENNSEYEQNTYKIAGSIARIVGGMLCAVLLIAEQFVTGHYNCGYWLIYCVMQLTHDIYIFVRTKSKVHLFSALCFIGISAVMVCGYVRDLLKG